jgi:4-hydroxy-3-methylbut-2-en-1-yl diphosphate synthase IspG/GcpE
MSATRKGDVNMKIEDAMQRLGESIRRIVCTTSDEATAHRKIEDAIRGTAQALNVPAIAVDQSFTNELLKLPLAERVKRLRQRGHRIPAATP